MFKVGEWAELTRTVTEEDIYLFAGITGDRNPLHTSSDFAARSRFGERIAHGMLTAGLISATLGTRLPGPGSIYISQTLHFLAPVRIGDEITARVEIVEILPKRQLRMRTQCVNQQSEVVLEGEAVILLPHRRQKREPIIRE